MKYLGLFRVCIKQALLAREPFFLRRSVLALNSGSRMLFHQKNRCLRVIPVSFLVAKALKELFRSDHELSEEEKKMEESVAIRFYKIESLAQAIYQRLLEEVNKLGFSNNEVVLKLPEEASYRLERDPSNSEFSLVGDWLNDQGLKLGTLLFHADGSFFVEHDIVKPHPTRSDQFVEAVNAWGNNSIIKAEPRLLEVPK
jgi:hypothetical protein